MRKYRSRERCIEKVVFIGKHQFFRGEASGGVVLEAVHVDRYELEV